MRCYNEIRRKYLSVHDKLFANERMRDMFIKKAIALALSLSLTGVLLAGCQSGTPSAAGSGSQTSAGTTDGEVVHIKLFTGKIETCLLYTSRCV